MDNRLRFRYRLCTVMSDGVTQEGRRSGPLVVPVQASEGAVPGKSGTACTLRGDAEGIEYRSGRSHTAGKSL